MKPQRRPKFNQAAGYLKSHGFGNPAGAATADAMADFLAKGGKVKRVKPVKGEADPGFRNMTYRRRLSSNR